MGAPAQPGDATWLHTFYNTSFWTTPGGDFSATISATTPVGPENTTHTWSGSGLLADVQAWVSNSTSNFGWIIRADEVDVQSAQRLNTRENTDNPPQLTVTYQVPCGTPTPTPTPITISGTVSYCSNPVPGPVPNVTMTLTGSGSASTLSDGSGNYQFSSLMSGGNYTVTPTKAALAPGAANINTVDVVAVQKQFLTGTFLTGCRLTAADVNSDSVVNTQDVIAVQRFFVGQTTAIANVGKYKFTPVNRTYTGIVANQTGQNYDTIVFGDVAAGFVELPNGPSQSVGDDGTSVSALSGLNTSAGQVALNGSSGNSARGRRRSFDE